MNREDLLRHFYALPTNRLEKLKKFSEVLLLPEEDLLTNVTMVQMLDKVFELADTYFPEWTDRTHSDFGRFLAELICLFSEKDFQYINLFAREMQLSSMTLYSNVYMRALELGHTPKLFKAAFGQFSLTVSAGSLIVINSGSLKIRRGDKVFTNIEPITILGAATESIVSVTLYCGNYINKTSEFNGRPLNYLDTNVDINTVNISTAGVLWDKVLRFGVSNNSAKVWFALPEENGQFSVVFGNGTYGVLPNIGDMFSVSYLSGAILQNDLGVKPCTIVEGSFTRSVLSVTQLSDIVPSVKQDTIDDVKAYTPLIFKTKSRIINEADCQDILNANPLIRKSKCVFWQDAIYFYVVLNDGTLPTQTFLDSLSASLNGSQLLGYTLAGLAATFVDMTPLKFDVYALQGFNLEDMVVNVWGKTSEYLNPIYNAEFGEDFVYSRFVTYIISNVTGVQNVVLKEVKGVSLSSQGAETLNQAEIFKPLTPSLPVTSFINGGVRYEKSGVTIDCFYVN